MRQSARVVALGCVLWTGASTCAPRAAADDVHLDNGEVIEGRATRSGDKVTIELPSGTISLSAAEVKHIDKRESSVERVDKMTSALKPEDIAKRMQLADYCRDHGMRDRERQLLQQVIEREPNHELARTRLGYVKSGNTWVTHAEHMRAQGKVQRDGQWVSREVVEEREHAEAELRARSAEADRTAQLESKKVALEQQKLELERQKLELEKRRPQPATFGYGYYGYGYADPRFRAAPVPGHVHPVSHPARNAWPINGMRDPLDSSWSLPGTRDPRDFTR